MSRPASAEATGGDAAPPLAGAREQRQLPASAQLVFALLVVAGMLLYFVAGSTPDRTAWLHYIVAWWTAVLGL